MNQIGNVFETFKGKDKGHCGHHYGSSYMESICNLVQKWIPFMTTSIIFPTM
jgi:hypothetical protein